MCMQHIMYRKKGIATILGTLIFIGIVFSAFVPMVLLMNQANIIYTQKLHETQIEDAEREDERLYVYAYPNEGSDTISISVHNDEVFPVQIVRVWINNVYFAVDKTAEVATSTPIGEFEALRREEETFIIKVTTARGNSFACDNGAIYSSEGVWSIPDMGITIHIVNNANSKFNISITNTTDPQWMYEYLTGPVATDVFKTVILTKDLSYKVEIGKEVRGKWVNLPESPVFITLDWPGPPFASVFVVGDGT